MKISFEMKVEYILYLLWLTEVKIKIRTIMLWLRYEQIKVETLIKLEKYIQAAKFQYELVINQHSLDVHFHIVITIIDDVLSG